MKGAFLPFKFIGDAAYPIRPWFYSSFKGEKDGLSREKAFWNFIQSSTRMAVERAFGILKGRWRILLKRIDMPLQNVPDIVTASLCLRNLCILENDDFDMDWARSVEEELQREATNRSYKEKLQREANMALGRMHERDRFMSLESLLKEMKELQNQHSRGEETTFFGPEEEEEMHNEIDFEEGETIKERQEKIKNVLADCTCMHELPAKSFYKAELGKKSNIWFEGYSSSSESEVE